MKQDFLDDLFNMQQIYAILFAVSNKIQSASDLLLGDVTSRQYMALLAIAHLDYKDTTLKNIAEKLSTSKQTANKLVTTLKKKKLVEIHNSEEDKRAINIALTEAGKEILIQASCKTISFLGDIFKDFTSEELEVMWKLLMKLQQYDGTEYSGFEEDANDFTTFSVTEKIKKDFEKAIEEFSKTRLQED